MSDAAANSKGLLADVRPGAVDITGQQRELFPFDAFEYTSEALTGGASILGFKDGWKLELSSSVVGETTVFEAGKLNIALIEVENLFADGVTLAGTGYIQSSNYVAGTSGFKINAAAGLIDIVDGTFSGTVTAATIEASSISGTTITGTSSISIGGFNVDSAGNATVSNISINGGTITLTDSSINTKVILSGGSLKLEFLTDFVYLQAGFGGLYVRNTISGGIAAELNINAKDVISRGGTSLASNRVRFDSGWGQSSGWLRVKSSAGGRPELWFEASSYGSVRIGAL